MLNRKNKLIFLKLISLFSVMRGYNIPFILLAQYLSAVFIFSPERRALDILTDFHLFILILASTLSIASGYIINNFYDSDKDLINKPRKASLDRIVSKATQLKIYFALNFLVFFIAFFVSFRAVIFFSCYIFLIWFYSHKLKKFPFIGNLTSVILIVIPFFGIMLHYHKYELLTTHAFNRTLAFTMTHAAFLVIILLIKDIIKDLSNMAGDLANKYKTIPIAYGEHTAKLIVTILVITTVLPVYLLIDTFDAGYMDIYFYVSYLVLIVILIRLWNTDQHRDYSKLHTIIKLILVLGIFSIALIKPSVINNGKNMIEHIL